MKRIHVFEFEDFRWFPSFLRDCMTRYIIAIHKILNSQEDLDTLIKKIIDKTGTKKILDLCSGSGGPLIEVVKQLRQEEAYSDVELTLSDLYPNKKVAHELNQGNSGIKYHQDSVDASHPTEELKAIRTMICSMHHMKPEVAKAILSDAKEKKQAICIFEISDYGFPLLLDWIALPINVLTVFFITPFVRPMSWQQLVFTYLIPLLPIFIAWDGAVSNMRTYTLSDMNELTKGLESADYSWEKGVIKGKSKKLFLIGTSN